MTASALSTHHPEAEAAVLGAVLLSATECADPVFEHLTGDDFADGRHRAVFEAMAHLYGQDDPIDGLSVSMILEARGELDRVGGGIALSKLMDVVPSVSTIDYYVGTVRADSQRRRLLAALSRIGSEATKSDKRVADLIDLAEQEIFAVASSDTNRDSPSMPEVMTQALTDLESALHSPTGVATGFVDFDSHVGNLRPGELTILAARPSMGKTAMALTIAQHVASSGDPTAVFTLEMTRRELASRLLSTTAGIDSHRIRSGRLSEKDWAQLTAAARKLSELPLLIEQPTTLTAIELRARARRLHRRHGGLGLLVVDYLQLMDAPGENRQQEISTISRGLKALARDLDVPVLAVSQLNRSVESREDKRPRLADLRESGALEQDADMVLFLYRDEYYNPDNRESLGVGEVIVAKNRNGPTTKVDLAFVSGQARWANLDTR